MVHALRESWRVLAPEGILVDLRPVSSNPALEILAGAARDVPGHLDDQLGVPDDIAAHEAMAEVVRRGYFALETQDTFKYGDYWNSLNGMLDYVAACWQDFVSISPAVIETARRCVAGAGADYRVRLQRKMHIAVYRKQEPPG